MYTVVRKLDRPGGKIDIVGSTVDLGHVLNGHDGRMYPRGVHRQLARVLTPCTVLGDSYRRGRPVFRSRNIRNVPKFSIPEYP